ncbi:MAG: glutamate--tRNA ligase [Methylococcales bacterium]|jgi:glutamyl-tRNA synthetase|nr:glutamate--tRNA ligase [Methylococcales bacterium]
MKKIKTRFAPSPTGYLHVGGARTALFSWLYARKHGGSFVLRIEDTDRERSTEESINAILEGMSWLGLDYDEGPFYQTQRFDRYECLINQLIEKDLAYYCYCTKDELEQMREQQMSQKQKPRYDGRCRGKNEVRKGVEPVIRFKNPTDGAVVVDDLVRGKVVFQNSELDDLIIARSDGTPTYNFSVVVDDMDMEITHVVRGDDHLNNTPRQINIIKALGGTPPIYAHLPMILGDDGQRLSKRHGAVSVLQYHEDGYLPDALLNYLVRLGWSHGDQEVFSVDEMIDLFDIADVNHSASAFNQEKLLWLNHQYIMNQKPVHVARYLTHAFGQFEVDPAELPELTDVVVAQRERAKTLKDMAEKSLFIVQDFDEFDAKAAKKHLRPVILDAFIELKNRLEDLEEWIDEKIHQVILAVAESFEMNIGKLGQPLRVAVTGSGVSPSIDVTLKLIGKEKTLKRMEKAIVFIENRKSSQA